MVAAAARTSRGRRPPPRACGRSSQLSPAGAVLLLTCRSWLAWPAASLGGAQSSPGTCHSRFVTSSAPAPAPTWSLSAARPGDLICHHALEGTANPVQQLCPLRELRALGGLSEVTRGHRGSWAGGAKGAVSCGTRGGGGDPWKGLGRKDPRRGGIDAWVLMDSCPPGKRGWFLHQADSPLFLPPQLRPEGLEERSGAARAPWVPGEGRGGRGWPGSAQRHTPGGLARATTRAEGRACGLGQGPTRDTGPFAPEQQRGWEADGAGAHSGFCVPKEGPQSCMAVSVSCLAGIENPLLGRECDGQQPGTARPCRAEGRGWCGRGLQGAVATPGRRKLLGAGVGRGCFPGPHAASPGNESVRQQLLPPRLPAAWRKSCAGPGPGLVAVPSLSLAPSLSSSLPSSSPRPRPRPRPGPRPRPHIFRALPHFPCAFPAERPALPCAVCLVAPAHVQLQLALGLATRAADTGSPLASRGSRTGGLRSALPGRPIRSLKAVPGWALARLWRWGRPAVRLLRVCGAAG